MSRPDPEHDIASAPPSPPNRLRETVQRSEPQEAHRGAPEPGAPFVTMPFEGRDKRIALYSGAGLFVAAAALLATSALPVGHRPAPAWLAGLGGLSLLTGLGLLVVGRTRRIGLRGAFAVTLWAIALIAVLVAVSGGDRSMYAFFYTLVIVHAAAFRTRRELIATGALGVLAFLAPVAYDDVDAAFAAVATVGAVPVLGLAVGLHLALDALRSQRGRLVERENEAIRLAESDALTGLGNYRVFWRRLASEAARARRYGEPFSLVILDLDDFKSINDELGHQAGDEALQRVAAALREALREEDLCCRQGGDEFSVIAVRAGETEARDLSERLVEAVSHITCVQGDGRPLSASAGWATFGRPASTGDELIFEADEALRREKHGRGVDDREREVRARPPARTVGREALSPPRRSGDLPEDRRLELLSGLARALAGAREENEVVETALAHLAGALDAPWVSAVRREPDGRLRLVGFASDGRARPTEWPPAPARTATHAAAREGRVSILSSPTAGTGSVPPGPRGELAVPVLVEDRPWGAVLVETERSDIEDVADPELALGMARQMGRALGAARAFARLPGIAYGEVFRLAGDVAASGDECWRVADLAWRVGRHLALDPDELRSLYLAALFHDVGTLGIPSDLLGKPARLNANERAVLHEHPLIGEELLRPLPLLREAAGIVRHEHERFDGDGYPDRLAGPSIPIPARVLAACDAWVAMTSVRPWRPAAGFAAARAELTRAAGSHFDPRVVAALLEVLDAPGREDIVAVAGPVASES